MTMLDDRPPVLTDLDDLRPVTVRRSVGRWRVAARLARREVRRRPWRTLLVVLLVAVPVAAIAVADTAYRSDRLPNDTRDFGRFAERLDVSGPSVSAASITGALDGIAPIQIGMMFNAPLRDEANPDISVFTQVTTFDPTTPEARGMLRLDAGRAPTADDDVLLDRSVARQLGVDVGDTFTLVRPHQAFRVVGIGSLSWAPATFLAPGFDSSVIRDTSRGFVAFVGSVDVPGQGVEAVEQRLASADLALDQSSGWGWTPRSAGTKDNDPIDLFLGWLGSAMVMGVLGIIIAAAFAVSGRRQLVTVGQLSAAGTDRSVIRRFLALQGTWTGVLGAALGLVAGRALVGLSGQLVYVDGHIDVPGFVALSGDLVRNDGRADVRAFDWALIGITAVVVATVAAIVPSRAVSDTSVLSALAGRRPIAKVRRGQVRLGIFLLAGGITTLYLAVVSADEANNGGGTLQGPAIIAIAAGFAVLAGTCCICPAIVRAIGMLASSAGGSVRLATRGLDRHRARAAAVIASIAAIGAVVVAVGAVGEQKQLDDHRNSNPFGAATLQFSSSETATGAPVLPDETVSDLRISVERIIGDVTWAQSSQIVQTAPSDREGAQFQGYTVAEPAVLRMYGFPSDVIDRMMAAEVAWAPHVATPGLSPELVASRLALPGVDPSSIVTVASPDPRFGDLLFVSPTFADAHELQVRPSALFARADHALSDSEMSAVDQLGTYDVEAAVFDGLEQPAQYLGVNGPYSSHAWRSWYSWALAIGALGVVLLVVSLGMALWAAEGRDERDVLIGLGAPPSTLAKTAGLKAWILATAGGAIAVPLGFGTLRLCIAAVHEHTQFPWLIAAVVLFVVPAIIATVTWLGSTVAQRVRPLQMSTAALD